MQPPVVVTVGSRDPSEYRAVKRLQFEYLCGFPHVLESGFSQGAVTRGQPFFEYDFNQWLVILEAV